MPDILIRGMEMPHNCFLCQLSYMRGERLFCCVTKDEVIRYKIASDCPLHELPPHGDLVDRDEIIEQIVETPFTMSMFLTVKECRAAIGAKEVIHNVVAYADAVIPSNKERSEDA